MSKTEKQESKATDYRLFVDWLKENRAAVYFLSIQFPAESKTTARCKVLSSVWQISRDLERELLGKHWIRKPYPLTGFLERGRDLTWHSHILLTCKNRTLKQVRIALDRAGEKYQLKRRTSKVPDIKVERIRSLDKVCGYCLKQFGLDRKTHIDTDRFITSETIFNLPCKQR